MHITKWGEYGILCSLYIAKRHLSGDKIIGAMDISKEHDIALDYTQQILQRLRKGGIINSVRGSKGGYQLSRAPEHISLLDIVKATEGDSFEIICEHRPLCLEHRCKTAGCCSIRPLWAELKEHIESFLMNYDLLTLAEIELANQRINFAARLCN